MGLRLGAEGRLETKKKKKKIIHVYAALEEAFNWKNRRRPEEGMPKQGDLVVSILMYSIQRYST